MHIDALQVAFLEGTSSKGSTDTDDKEDLLDQAPMFEDSTTPFPGDTIKSDNSNLSGRAATLLRLHRLATAGAK